MNIYVLHLLFTQKQENGEFINDVTHVLTGLNLIQSTIVLTVLSYWFGKGEWTMGSTACKLHQFSKSFVSISTGLLISLACLTKYMTFINHLRYVFLTRDRHISQSQPIRDRSFFILIWLSRRCQILNSYWVISIFHMLNHC